MRFSSLLKLSLLSFIIATPALSNNQPYAGQEKREIKSLSSEDVDGYLLGKGMGFAKAAELNNYPGPRHLLDLKKELGLSEEQVSTFTDMFYTMEAQAQPLGKKLVQAEAALNDLFASGQASEESLADLTSQIGKLKANLRYVHLSTHIKTRPHLSRHQIYQYNQLRGYGSSAGHAHHH
jgi:Spy/CpxP family protein refolding chaperone